MRKALTYSLACILFAALFLTSCNKSGTGSTASGKTGSSVSGASSTQGTDTENPASEDGSGAAQESGTNGASGGDGASGSGATSKTGVSVSSVDTSRDETVDDGFEDWSKTFFRSSSLSFDKGHPDLFENDASRAIRTKIEQCEIIYKVNPVREFSMVAYFGVGKMMTDDFTFYVSKDNKSWTAVKNIIVLNRLIPASGWERRTYTAYDLGSDYRYLKIVTPKTGAPGEAYTPNIGRILINRMDAGELDKMGGYVRRNSRTIYVDADGGNDKNNGFSEKNAIKTIYELGKRHVQPGDKILLKSGSSFTGQLGLVASGTDSAPIVVDKYGSGAKPKIVGKGDYAVHILASNVTVKNLDISNPKGVTGITVATAVAGAMKNITIANCDIHDVKGDAAYSHESGGIHIVAKSGSTKEIAVPSWFDGLTISNNTITDVSRSGIFMHSFWTSRDGSGFNTYVNDSQGWYPSKNVKISGNSLNKVGGDGIVVIGSAGPLIERNTLLYGQTQGRKGTFNAGIWPMVCNDAVIQYNEVGYMSLANGAGDGQGFDIDGSNKNTLFQYNYSHDNDGGFLLICAGGGDFNDGIIVRNNLSVNDARTAGRAILTLSGPVSNAKIYNNTIFAGSGTAANFMLIHSDDFTETGAVPKNFTFTNNVFAAASGRTATYNWAAAAGFVFDNNVFHGISAPAGSGKVTVRNTKTFDPQFVKAGASGNGLKIGEQYRPAKGSPLLSGGTVIPDNGGKDYFGKSTSGKGYYGAFAE